MNMVMSAQGIITMGNLAKLLLQCTDTFCAKKNWNSHGASVGSAICQLASIMSQMQSASVNELDQNFNVLIPQENVQTGSKHGHHNVCYTEYMCSKLEPRVMGNLEVYLNLDIFRYGDLNQPPIFRAPDLFYCCELDPIFIKVNFFKKLISFRFLIFDI